MQTTRQDLEDRPLADKALLAAIVLSPEVRRGSEDEWVAFGQGFWLGLALSLRHPEYTAAVAVNLREVAPDDWLDKAADALVLAVPVEQKEGNHDTLD